MTGFSGRSMNGKSSASIPGCRDLSPLAPPGYADPWKERQILQGDPGRIDIAPPSARLKTQKTGGNSNHEPERSQISAPIP